VPSLMHTDGGSEFDNRLHALLYNDYGIKHTKITPQHPQANPTERTNQSMQDIIAKAVAAGAEQTDWPLLLSAATMAYNSSLHSTTGQVPNLIVFGRLMRTDMDLSLNIARPSALPHEMRGAEIIRAVRQMRPLVKDTIKERQAAYKAQHDKHLRPRTTDIGDYVRLRQPDIEHEPGHMKKLRSNWTGPWLVLERIGENVIQIQNCNNTLDVQRVNVERTAPFYMRDKAEDDTQELQDDEFEVERIVAQRDSATVPGKLEFRVKWKGYRKKDNHWVQESDLNAPQLLQAWRLRQQALTATVPSLPTRGASTEKRAQRTTKSPVRLDL